MCDEEVVALAVEERDRLASGIYRVRGWMVSRVKRLKC